MDHADARELLEVAAVEPGGLARLMAGDTPEAASLAGHLAGCAECTAEMARLRHAAGVLRGVVRTTPPPELRERTLALVRAVGRERAAGRTAAEHIAAGAVAAGAAAAPGGSGTESAPPAAPRRLQPVSGRRAPLARVVGLAAAVAVAILGTGLAIGVPRDAAIADRDATIQRQAEAVKDLVAVTVGTLRVVGQPDARYVTLASTTGAQASGSLVFSKAARELVVTATGLTEPGAGYEFRCWLEAGGRRQLVGKMFFGGGLAYWVGKVDALSAVPADASFGVSLVDLGNPSGAGQPFLTGRL